MKIKLAIIISIFSTAISFANTAQRDRELLLENKKDAPINAKEIRTYPEVFVLENSILKERDSRTGLETSPYYTKQDSSRFAVAYSFSVDYEDLTKVQTLEGTYSNQFDNSYKQLWWSLQFKRTSAKYNAIADERTTASGDSNSVANTLRRDNIQTFSIFGLGLSHRFKTLSYAWDTDRLFEFISVYANYILHNDQTDEENYNGFGYTADYSLTYRINKAFYYGGKISYDWAFVQRSQVDEEKLADRSLVFGWTTIGLEFGYIY